MIRDSLALKFKDGKVKILDQQMLPQQELWIDVEGTDHLISIIKELKVRGAPLIGVAAALVLATDMTEKMKPSDFLVKAEKIRKARPTAVNLMNAIDRMIAVFDQVGLNINKLLDEALNIFDEDKKLCDDMAKAASALIRNGDNIITHCNTGGLATAGVGTALGAIIKAHRDGKKIHVYVDETRPLLQGARLTAWELQKAKVPYTLICDNMAATLMSQKKIHHAFVGADRIALNGDFANKIGTYALAINCHYHKVKFHVVAPKTTIDPKCKSGAKIPIETRNPDEVRGVSGSFGKIIWSPKAATVFNPSFDVTPVDLVTTMTIDNRVFKQAEIKKGKLKELF